MKKPLFSLLLMVSSIVILSSTIGCKTKSTSGEADQASRQAAVSTLPPDSIQSIIGRIKKAFCDLPDKTVKLPSFDSSANLLLSRTYLSYTYRPFQEIPEGTAKSKIQAFWDSNPDLVKVVWVPLEDVLRLLGIKDSYQNLNDYDGFRFYMAKDIDNTETSLQNRTTLVMVATKQLGARDHEDITSGSRFLGIYDKFDPCPPPGPPCPGLKLAPPER